MQGKRLTDSVRGQDHLPAVNSGDTEGSNTIPDGQECTDSHAVCHGAHDGVGDPRQRLGDLHEGAQLKQADAEPIAPARRPLDESMVFEGGKETVACRWPKSYAVPNFGETHLPGPIEEGVEDGDSFADDEHVLPHALAICPQDAGFPLRHFPHYGRCFHTVGTAGHSPSRRLLLHGGMVVTEAGVERLDLLVEGTRIAGLGLRETIDADDELDLDGDLVLPGAIDLHVHFEEPGDTEREGYRTATQAAAAGGITMVVEHPLSDPPTTTAARYIAKRELVEPSAFVDFGLWGGAIPGNFGEFQGMVEAGAPGFKAFMVGSEPDYPRLDAKGLRETMREAAQLGAIVAVHAEDHDEIEQRTSILRADGRHDPAAWGESRPPSTEVAAVAEAIALAEETECRLHLVHVSVPEAVQLATDARRRGLRVVVETTLHHLVLDASDLARQGVWAKTAPPLRPRPEVEAMWDRVRTGEVDFLASDHAPWEPREKEEGLDSIWKAPNGLQSLQFLTVLGLEAWTRRGLALKDWVAMVSARPARWLGAYPRKGTLAPESDADLAVYRIGDARPVRAGDLLDRHRWTPFDGMPTTFQVLRTMVRGEWVFADGQVASTPTGRFVALPSAAPIVTAA